MTPRVSVILPAYQAAPTLGGALASIRQQTYANWELIVVDDGSSDETSALVEREAKGDARIRLIRQPHAGIVAALTQGLAAARGALIARMDADDTCHPDRLAEQVALLEREPTVGLASCLVEFGGDRNANAGYALHVDWLNGITTPDTIALNRFIESPLAHPSVMFRRDLLAAHGGYRDGDFPEDYELWLRWLDAGVRMAKVLRPLLRWHDPPRRLSRTDRRYDPEAFFRVKAPWLAREVIRRVPGAAGSGGPRAVFVWGAGRPTRKRVAHLRSHGVAVAGYVDIDPKKCGRQVGGVPVIPPSDIPAPDQVFILGYVSSRGARELIRHALAQRGFTEGADFLMCA